MATLNELFSVGNVPPVNLIPILAYIPERLAAWKMKMSDLRQRTRALFASFYQTLRARTGSEGPEMMQSVLVKQDQLNLSHEDIFLVEGAQSVGSIIENGMILLLANPHVQKRAHEELDQIVGTERQPTLEDIAQMPYVRAVIDEIYRMRPSAPLGIPHAASEDVMYKGYRISKGSMIMHNHWAIYHSPDLFDELILSTLIGISSLRWASKAE
ncbi:hypothetical protein FRB93_000469 [Tulasnella sp. JGI-2019a]|nr:hypothetical protein FRB93_000469 [Tulasnella sp. JGI-2019a]